MRTYTDNLNELGLGSGWAYHGTARHDTEGQCGDARRLISRDDRRRCRREP